METLSQQNRKTVTLSDIGIEQITLMRIIPELEAALEEFLGKKLRPSPAKALADFGRLPEGQRALTVKGLEGQLDFVREALRLGLDAYNEQSLVRLAARKLNLFIDDNSLQKIENTDVVEVFSHEHTQVYRSYSCFALCNYSIAELVSYPWYELYNRPSWVTDRLLELSNSVFEGKSTYLSLEDKVRPYLLQETQTEEKEAFEIREKFYSRMISSFSRQPYILSVKSIKPVPRDSTGDIAFL